VIVSLYAAQEEVHHETAAEDDAAEVRFPGASHLLVWLVIRHPDLLDTRAADPLIAEPAQDGSAFHQVFYATIVVAGHEPLIAALALQKLRINVVVGESLQPLGASSPRNRGSRRPAAGPIRTRVRRSG
jgi:hypothetical protein